MAKKGNTSSSDANKKKSKKNKSAPNVVAMKVKVPKPNPFESMWSRRKFDVLGKKRKGEERRMGTARSQAIDKRKKTLLKEYEQSGKSSVFVDKRIGEENDELQEFGKAIMRSQRERQMKLNKKSKYNLSDEDDNVFDISGDTSLGNFSERDDFDEELLLDDDAAEAEPSKMSAILKQLDAHNTQNTRNDSVEGDENRRKSKKEVMEEVILKSKYFKAQKAKEKEDNEQLMDELDKKFTSMVKSEVLLSTTEPGKLTAMKALVNRSIPAELMKKDELSAAQKIETSMHQDKPDAYDKLVKSMSLDIRARPSDRTKTPEEIAVEKREQLEKLEEERQKRMHATDDSSDEDNDNVEKPSALKQRSISGDDLGDSFMLDDEPGTRKGWIDEILEREDEENSESEEDDSSEESESTGGSAGEDDEGSGRDDHEDDEGCAKTVSFKDWEQSDDDIVSLDSEDDDEQEEEESKTEKEKAKGPRAYKKEEDNSVIEIGKRESASLDAKKGWGSDKKPSTQMKSLPYLIEAPKSFEELLALFENCGNADIIILIERIRVSNAIKHAAENRKKIQYFAVLANEKPLKFELLNLLVKPLMEMSVEIPYFAAICARQRISRIRSQFCVALKNSEVSSWPSLKSLFLLRLWSMIFSCSDFRHAVMTPAVLLICEYLMRCPIRSGKDVATGTFLCSMLLTVTKESQKFCPEAIMFLRTMLLAATDGKQVLNQDFQFYHFTALKELQPLLCISDCIEEITCPLNFLMLMDLPEDSSLASVLATVIDTLQGFVHINKGLSSFPEIFLPTSVMLLEVAEQKYMPEMLQDKVRGVSELIRKKADEHQILRRPLQMRKQKPVPIRLIQPKFEDNFAKGRDYDPDRERAEERKLKKQLKCEAKGACRELRKDNSFLFELKDKEKALLNEERAEKYGKARAFLQEQEYAFKSGQLGKAGRKRRR